MKRPHPLLALALALALVLALVLVAFGARPAFAQSDPCSVVRKCSAEGIACLASDRRCQDGAIARGLEVVCDVSRDQETEFVYCSPHARDSKVVWILLGAAALLGVAGSALAYVTLKTLKKKE